MKIFKLSFLLFLISATIFVTSCGNGEGKTQEGETDNTAVETEQQASEEATEFDMLVTYLEDNGNFLNAPKAEGGAPKLVKAKAVKDMLGEKVHVIDIRDPKTFSEGHIKGAVNVKASDLLFHLNNEVDATSYDNIIIACYTGQTSTYMTSILNVLGFTNVSSLKWGMTSWNSKFDEKWSKNIGNEYADQLQTKNNPKPEAVAYPELMTGMTDGKSILEARANEVIGMGLGAAKITEEDVFAMPEEFHIVTYWPMELYSAGHITGAYQYSPHKSLQTSEELKTLPTDKPIVVHCYTGQHSAAVVAYLRILGYDAYTLLYGANSFMNQKLVDANNHGFTSAVSNNFDYETSEYVEPEGGAQNFGGC